MACAHRHAPRRPLEAEPRVDVVEIDLTVEHTNEDVEADRTHQRFGERVVDVSLAVVRALRCAATIVAVAPTLDGQVPGVVVCSCHLIPTVELR